VATGAPIGAPIGVAEDYGLAFRGALGFGGAHKLLTMHDLCRPNYRGVEEAVGLQVAWEPVIEVAGPVRDFAVTLSDGRRVVGHDRERKWSVSVYASEGRLLGYASASTRLRALEQAGLSGGDAGEVLGRSGI
jgi:hypothetical protein